MVYDYIRIQRYISYEYAVSVCLFDSEVCYVYCVYGITYVLIYDDEVEVLFTYVCKVR